MHVEKKTVSHRIECKFYDLGWLSNKRNDTHSAWNLGYKRANEKKTQDQPAKYVDSLVQKV